MSTTSSCHTDAKNTKALGDANLESAAERTERLVLEHAPTIKYVAQRLARRLPSHISVEDLINVGVVGLIDAIEKYDDQRDNTFKTYAEFRIRGAMLDELRGLDWVPRSVRQKEHALSRAYNELERQLGRLATDEEVAAHLDITCDEFYTWLHQVKGGSLVSIESPGTPGGDRDALNLLDFLAADDENSPHQLAQTQGMKELIAHAIDELPHQEKVVISLYYYEELIMKEIGNALDITESRVSQIHTKAILRLRSKLRVLVAA